MKFIYVNENNAYQEVAGSNHSIFEQVIFLTCAEKNNSGFIGAIDNAGKLRGTLAMHQYRGKFRNPLFDFIRKYRAIECLESLSKRIKEQQDA